MMGDNGNHEHSADAASSVDTHATEAARESVNEAAAAMTRATETTAAHAEQLTTSATDAAATAVRGASSAFSQVRERLDARSTPFSNPAFDTMRQSGEVFGKGLESGYASTLEGMAEFNSKAIAAWRSNAESAIQHWQSLAGVKSFSEAIALSAEHTRKQMEALNSQTRELSALATRIVRDASDPLKAIGR